MSPKNTITNFSSTSRAVTDKIFLRMNYSELRVVVKLVRLSEPKPLLVFVNAINRLGNGWIYLPVAMYVIFLREWRLLFALVAGVSIAHLFYGMTKPRFARIRPCHFAENIPVRSRCLDQYSFPSGHCMTLSVVGLLFCWQHPAAIPALTAGLILLCWARVASGHHYPSDLAAGIGVGSFIATSVALWLL